MHFVTNGFEAAYTVDVDPEHPGDGDWRCEVVAFDADGHAIRVEAVSGPPVLRINPVDGPAWVAMFEGRGLGMADGVFATPAQTRVAVVSAGLAYVVETARPQTEADVVSHAVDTVVACTDPPLLLLGTAIDIVALGRSGVAWRTPRLCLDDLKLLRADGNGIICWGDNSAVGHGSGEIILDPLSGVQIAGRRFESFWPEGAR